MAKLLFGSRSVFVFRLNVRSERLEKNIAVKLLRRFYVRLLVGLSADLHLLEAQVALALLLLNGHLDDGAHEQLVDGGAHQEDAEHAGRPNPPRSVHTKIPVSV
jgi:hypothetical protein